MKNKISIIALLALVIMTSCDMNEFDTPPTTKNYPMRKATTTINEVITKYLTGKPTNPKGFGVYPIDSINGKNDLIITGVVTSTDKSGAAYKYIIVQELGATPAETAALYSDGKPHAIRISIETSGISAYYPIGQIVSVRLNGMHIGFYGRCPQIGTYFVDKDPKKGELPGAMPFPFAQKAIQCHGEPNFAKVKEATQTLTLKDLSFPRDIWRVIQVDNAHLEKSILEETTNFARSTKGVGYPISHFISDASIAPKGYAFATSEFTKFANYPLPKGTGSVCLIVGWYENSDRDPIDYEDAQAVPNVKQKYPNGMDFNKGPQLSIRGIYDLLENKPDTWYPNGDRPN